MRLPSDGDRTGRNFGREELRLLEAVIESGTLNGTRGTMVAELEKRFAEKYGVAFCRTTTSGTAAIHTAVAAIDPEPGDEIITTPITDMGALAAILYQTAVPIFADVDPLTYNVTAETIAPRIGRRTRAIIVTHLFGNPCDMDPILALARARDLPVIEDAAQAYLAEYKNRRVGTLGDIGCFSLQQTKHMTAGEGGIVVSRHERFSRRMRLFVDKAWGYGDPAPDHDFLALNYRMTELQGAVALAQLGKLDGVVASREQSAARLTELIAGVPGVAPPAVTPESRHVYWKYPLRIDNEVIRGGVDRFAAGLANRGIHSAPRYIRKPAFQCQIFTQRNTFGRSRFPFEGECRKNEPPVAYEPGDFPGTFEALGRVVALPWNEFYTEEHVLYIAGAIRDVAAGLSG